MIVTCKNCNTSFNLSDELVKDTGSKVKCSKCNYIFKVFPLHIQNESDLQLTDSQQEPEEITSTKSYLEPQQQQIEGKESLQKTDVDKDWDLSEVEKILQEETGKTFNGDTLERDKQLQEDYDDFEFGDFGDLFGEEDSSDDQKKEKDLRASEKESDLQITAGESKVEDIDLSELDDFLKEDDDWMKSFSEIDADSKASGLEVDNEKEVTSDFLEPDNVKQIEDIDLSELDDLFREDEIKSLQKSVSLQDHNILTEDDGINFDLDLQMEKDSVDGREDDKSSDDFKMHPDFGANDQVDLRDFDPADIDFSLGSDEKDPVADLKKPAKEELNFEFKDHEKKESDEEFDLSDLEEIIDIEEESGADTKALKTKIENEEQELEFYLALEPDIDEGKSVKVFIEGEKVAPDASEKAAGTESDYSEKIDGAYLTEKDDYPSKETEENFNKFSDTGTLTDTERTDKRDDDNLDTENEEIKPKSRFGKMVLVVLVFILLAAAGFGVFTVLNITGSKLPIIGSYMKPETPDPGNLKIIAFDLNSKFEKNQLAGKIFIITGLIKNEYSEARSFIKITGKLYEPAKKLSHTEQVYAGNVFSELELRSLDMEAIKNRLNNRFGQNRSNVDIKPGQSVPFMIIFSNLTQKLEEFTVEIESSSPS